MLTKQESTLVHIMHAGFEKAAKSFSVLINKPVKIVNGQTLVLRQSNDYSYVSEEQGELYILTTSMIGDITGKSYLILSQEECQEIFVALNSKMSNQTLNEAFLLEIDNIISASVISEISNGFDLEIYGDVPALIKLNASDLQSYLEKESKNQGPSSVIFSNTTFQFDNKDKVHPQFIWKISSKIFEVESVDK